jgi:hypothetical protein
VFVLLFAVPALLVVVVGYVVGHRVWTWLGGLVDPVAGTSLVSGAEAAGWVTGLLLLLVCTLATVRSWRARRRAEPPG